MHATRRAVIIRSLSAFLFLLIALAPYAAVIFGLQDAVFLGVFVTPLFLVASEFAGIRAVAAGSHVTDRRKLRVLVWSLVFLLSALAALVMLRGSYLVAAVPYCHNSLTARSCMENLGFPTYFCIGAFAAASLLAFFMAPLTALSNAARTGKWVWFLGILIFLLGSLAAWGSLPVLYGANVISVLSLRNWSLVAQMAAPLLMPFIALCYSLTGRERPKPQGVSKDMPIGNPKQTRALAKDAW